MPAASALLLLPQSPFDSASGAAISERTTCEMLSRNGWSVRAIGTTSTEHPHAGGSLELAGVSITRESGSVRFCHRGVEYRLIETGGTPVNDARRQFADELDAAVEAELRAGVPGLVITYGSSAREIQRRARLRAAGCKVVFSVRNLSYISANAFDEVDLLLTASRYVSEHYLRSHGMHSVALPVPVIVEDVTAVVREPVFCTMINPAPVKGVDFFVCAVAECLRRDLDVPFLVVEARGSMASLQQAFRRTGVDGTSLTNLSFVANTPNIASIYAVTRVLLVPSLMEPAGRVAVEAQLNGIPVIASDRGGLPETMRGGGFVLPVTGDNGLPDPVSVSAWLDLVERLWNDTPFFETAFKRALEATVGYRSGAFERDRVAAFKSVL